MEWWWWLEVLTWWLWVEVMRWCCGGEMLGVVDTVRVWFF
jgi:hypothetical protein